MSSSTAAQKKTRTVTTRNPLPAAKWIARSFEETGGAPLPEEVTLDHECLLPPTATPAVAHDPAPRADGAPLTRIGEAVERLLVANGRPAPLPLLRRLEAALVHCSYNEALLRTAAPIARTGRGVAVGVAGLLLRPMGVSGAPDNGRSYLPALGLTLRAGSAKDPKLRVHDPVQSGLPGVEVASAVAFETLQRAHHRALGFEPPAGDEAQLVADLTLEGMNERPFLAPLAVHAGAEPDWLLVAYDANRRLAAINHATKALTGGIGNAATAHWHFDADGTRRDRPQVRPMVAGDRDRVLQLATFSTSPTLLEPYPLLRDAGHSARDKAAVADWTERVHDTDPRVRALLRLATFTGDLVLWCEPRQRTVTATEVIRARVEHLHVPWRKAKEWADEDVFGNAAISALERMRHLGDIDAGEFEALTNPYAVALDDRAGQRPFRNGLVRAARIVDLLCISGREVTDEVLSGKGTRADRRAKAAAALVTANLGHHKADDGSTSPDGRSMRATIGAMVRHSFVTDVDAHPGAVAWSDLLDLSPLELGARAAAEQQARLKHQRAARKRGEATDAHLVSGAESPAERALVVMAFLGGCINPRLLEMPNGGEHFTRTGRGGRGSRGDLGKAEPMVFLRRMLHTSAGIDGLVRLYEAAVSSPATLPTDDAGDVLGDSMLREHYLNEPDASELEQQLAEVLPEEAWYLLCDTLYESVASLSGVAQRMVSHRHPPAGSGDADESTWLASLTTLGLPPSAGSDLAGELHRVLTVIAQAAAAGQSLDPWGEL